MLVSCIMPTRGRPEWAPRALECFFSQTYAQKELIVLDDRDQPSFAEPPAGFGIVYHRMQRRMLIGAKRNLACSRAVGDVIAHWDDDDYSAPERLEQQIEMLRDGAEVCGFHSMVFEKPSGENWLYRKDPPYCIGSSLMYRREFWRRNPFPDVKVAEDEAFVRAAVRQNVLVSADADDMMRASIHPGNTSPRVLHGRNWSLCA